MLVSGVAQQKRNVDCTLQRFVRKAKENTPQESIIYNQPEENCQRLRKMSLKRNVTL